MHCLIPGHFLDAVRSVVFIVHVTGHVFEVVHVRADQHVPQLHKVAVRLVLHWRDREARCSLNDSVSKKCRKKKFVFCRRTFNDSPGIEPPSHPLAPSLHHRVAADHSERCALLYTNRHVRLFGCASCALCYSGKTTVKPGFTFC